jgi:glutaredoxin 3
VLRRFDATPSEMPRPMAKIVIYTIDWCPYCTAARRLLASKGVEFEEINLTSKPAERAELREMSGSRTVPQIYIGDTHVGGCDELYALERAGRLDPLLAQVA